jgi:hypothetical protein
LSRSNGTVLMLAAADDGEAEYVGDELAIRGIDVARLDTAWFPAAVAVSAELGASGWLGRITAADSVIDLADLVAIFYRQPPPFTFPTELTESERRFATVEARFGLGGLLASLPVRWVPAAPGRVADAEYKPVQLATAARSGLPVPDTLLSNWPEAARAFAKAQPDGAVYKAIMHKVIADDGDLKLIYTSPVLPDEIDDRASVTMHQFQTNLAAVKTYDVRLVATRRGQVAVAIRTDDPDGMQDFRAAYDALTYQVIDVPDAVVAGCRSYLRALDLRLGVFDFCVTPAGWHFLECGPGALWAWIQEATGAPIASLVVDALMEDAP